MRRRPSPLPLPVLLLAATAAVAAPTRDDLTFEAAPSGVAFVPPALAAPPPPCDGNNMGDNFFDGALMGGPLVAISWFPTVSAPVTRIEVFTGEAMAPSELAIWSDDGGAPSKPLASLGVTGSFLVSPPNTWYGAATLAPIPVVAGVKYWVVWDPTGGEQCACTDSPADIQQTYWGSFDGTVAGGADWFGPFSFTDRRWKFRMECGGLGCPDADGDGVCDDEDLCPDSAAPDLSPEVRLGVNRWALVDGDDTFDTTEPNGVGPKVTFTLADTRGCSCSDIIEALGIGEGHDKYGCSTGIMRRWVDLVTP